MFASIRRTSRDVLLASGAPMMNGALMGTENRKPKFRQEDGDEARMTCASFSPSLWFRRGRPLGVFFLPKNPHVFDWATPYAPALTHRWCSAIRRQTTWS